MELKTIVPSQSQLWEQTWRLYTESFPEYERRRVSSHEMAAEDPGFHTRVALENGNLLALLFYWTYGDNMIFIEHVAVNPAMRGRNIGSTLLKEFAEQNPGSTIILEIDPPQDEVSRRRLEFYRRLGYSVNDYQYTHPSFQKKGREHPLVLLSLPEPITQDDFDGFLEFMRTQPLKYIE